MTTIRTLLTTGAIAALAGIGSMAAMSTAAQAHTVCNRDGDCWSTHDRYDYPASIGVNFHRDNWRARNHWNDRNEWRYHHRQMHWRDSHEGRGYYRQGLWITF